MKGTVQISLEDYETIKGCLAYADGLVDALLSGVCSRRDEEGRQTTITIDKKALEEFLISVWQKKHRMYHKPVFKYSNSRKGR